MKKMFFLAMLWSLPAFGQRPDLKFPFAPGVDWQLTRGAGVGFHQNYGLWADDRYAVDFASAGCTPWRAPALAAAQGTISRITSAGNYGNSVMIDHGNGYRTRYAHLDEVSVRNGEFVSQGDQIGLVGNTGNVEGQMCRAHPGTHLHFVLYRNGVGVPIAPISGMNRLAVGTWYQSNNNGNQDCHRDRVPGSAAYCTADCPCAIGEGDCDRQNDCDPGLICSTDVGPQYGYAGWVDICEVDHAVLPPPPPQPANCHVGQSGSFAYCTRDCPCAAGEGDCDNAAECIPGTHCEHNIGPQFGWHASLDVCMPDGGGQVAAAPPPPPPPPPAPPPPQNCHRGALGGYTYCSAGCPCAARQGDCDNNSECQQGTECRNNIGAQFGWAANVDVCMPVQGNAAPPPPPPAPPPQNPPAANCHSGSNGDGPYCSDACKCGHGEGDCDRNSHCQAGLVCKWNVGANYGWDRGTDVCERP